MILCFDIGGTAIKCAEATGPEDVVAGPRVPTPVNDLEAFISVLRQAVGAATRPPRVIAIAIAGVVDPRTGLATVANIPCLNGIPMQAVIEDALGLPVVIGNDADCFALAEAAIGVGRGHDVVFGLILGTGVGGGVVVRDQLINATGGFAGEIGHGPVAQRAFPQLTGILPAFPCGCGLTGCLDAICSARGLEKLHHALNAQTLDSIAITRNWEKGDRRAAQTVEIWLELLSGPLAMVQNLLGADVIAVGGGLSNATRLVEALDSSVRSKVLRRFDDPLVVPALCKTEPGLVGAALLGGQYLNSRAG